MSLQIEWPGTGTGTGYCSLPSNSFRRSQIAKATDNRGTHPPRDNLIFYNPPLFVRSLSPQVGTGGMDSKVSAATWAMDRGVSVVICNGMQEKAVKTIVGGRKVGTFFTESLAGSSNSVEAMAENGNNNSQTHSSASVSLSWVDGVACRPP